MGNKTNRSRFIPYLLMAVAIGGMAGATANAAITVIGTQYQQDILYSEYNCIYDLATNYPTSCPTVTAGANAHVYLKNTGGSAVTVSDVTLAGYSLATVIKLKTMGGNLPYSIYYYWDNPPSAIMNAGEPVWYRVDPNPIPAGGVSRAVVRLRYVPTTSTVSVGIVDASGTTVATVTKDATTPRIASVGFSPDLDKVYIHWRRSGGAGPTTIKVDDVDVTAYCSTVSNASLNFAVTTYTPASPLGNISYHVYQGIYSDGKTATISLRSFVNIFSYGTYGAGPTSTQQDGRDWIDTCHDRGVNLLIYNNGSDGLISLLNTEAGRQYAADRDYSTMAVVPWEWGIRDPRFWYNRDEPDAHDWHIGCSDSPTNIGLPCDKKHHTGTQAMPEIIWSDDASRRANYPTTLSGLNIDCTYGPYNYYNYGQATDIGMTDPYYTSRQASAYWGNTLKIPLWEKAELYIYGTTRVHVAACEPNPVLVALSSTGDTADMGDGYWPYSAPETKRTEAYYAIAGGAKSMGYWWFLGDTGLGTYTEEALALWKEIGLLGNEFRAAQPIIVTSHPVDMTLTGSTNVWARALASGNDTLMLVVVNDNHYNDIDGYHNTALSNATLTATLPPWMTSSPYAFEITAEGVHDVTSSLNGSALSITLGTVNVTRMIVVTTNANLQSTIDQRYKEKCWEGVCTFASDHCHLPGFTQQPVSANVADGGSVTFSVTALGVNLNYQWQKDGTNISNGGHYSGCTTATLTVSNADTNDEADYRCMLSNAYYSNIASDAASLTVSCSSGVSFQNGNFEDWPSGSVAPNWTGAYSATTASQFARMTSPVHGGSYSQKVKALDAANAWAHVYQAFDTNVGDAINIMAYAYPTAIQTGVNPQVGVNTSSTRPTSWLYTLSTFTKNTWCTIGPLGFNATGTTTYLFLDVKRVGAVDTSTYWDDVAVYRAFVPPAPAVTNASSCSTLNVNVDPGCNLSNGNAQYAITIGGGAYTLGTHWVQANGSVSTSAVWQTEATWGTKTVTGLTSNTTYTFEVKARYSGTYTQETALSTGAQGTPHTILVITQQPATENICPGATASFSVAATGEGTVTYQWQKNSVNQANGGHYSGCTTATMTITGADTNDAASYRCRVSDVGGSIYSDEASLMLKAATSISSHPSAQDVCAGEYIELYVGATGEGTLTYQWQKNSANISDGGHYSGCTTDVLAITGTDTNDAANYRCVVTGGCGSEVNSNQAAVTLKTATTISSQPSAQDVCPGANALFSVTATGEGTVTYQWQKNSANVDNGGHYSGCTTATMTVTGADTNDVADYRCVVTAECGDPVNSNQAALTLKDNTAITTQPTAQNICSGTNVNFTVAATGEGTLTYQWQKAQANISNGGHYSGCTTATLTVTGADTNDAANYRCKVTGGCGSLYSNEVALSLKSDTTVTTHPTAQSVCSGSNASFTVAASGDGTLTYQWQKAQANINNGGHYSGCTTATLAITGADTNDVANYRCKVTGGCGSVNSNEAALSLKSATSISAQPSNQTVATGGSANFSVTATGDSVTYQWQKNQANLNDGGHYSGCTTATLSISSADSNDQAYYRCKVTGTCGTATSNEAALTVNTCPSYTAFYNGNFEDWPSGLVAPSWTGAYSATVANQFKRSTSPVHGGSYAQGVKARDATNAWAHVYQGFSTNVGDAITITGYAYPTALSTGVNPQVGVNTSSSRPSSWLVTMTSFTKNAWNSVGTLTCNATGTTTYLFLDVKRVGAVDTTTYWDDIVVYRAHVPPAPAVTRASSTSLNVDVAQGCNSTNANAQYAITISGGGYTEGTHWVQANGTVSTTTVWQTDSTWGNKTVTGLTTSTTYTFKAQARYSGTYTQATSLGSGAQGTP